ncbi:glycine--tRNA ligase subunit beta [Amylibacter sp.]|nr:glycine--tRNA ligase subunit beta [Amylibacter sp.]
MNEKPTGSKDPFALRRSALGVIRLVIDNEINDSIERMLAYGFYLNSISIQSLHSKSQAKYIELKDNSADQILNMIDESQSQKIKEILKDLISFFHDRLKVYLRDKDIKHDVIDACLAMPNNTNLEFTEIS